VSQPPQHIGFTAASVCSCFHEQIRCFGLNRPRKVNPCGSSLHVRHALQSSFAIPPAQALSGSSTTCSDFVPLRGSGLRPLTAGAATPSATFRPQVFSTSRRFSPPTGSWVYFTPLPRPGFRSFRGLATRRSRPRSSRALCLPVVSPGHTRRLAPTPHDLASTPRPCSAPGRVCSSSGSTDVETAPLCEFLASSGTY